MKNLFVAEKNSKIIVYIHCSIVTSYNFNFFSKLSFNHVVKNWKKLSTSSFVFSKYNQVIQVQSSMKMTYHLHPDFDIIGEGPHTSV
jgi:hypothetical protein